MCTVAVLIYLRSIDDTNLHAAIGTLMCNISQIVTKILISHLLSISLKKR